LIVSSHAYKVHEHLKGIWLHFRPSEWNLSSMDVDLFIQKWFQATPVAWTNLINIRRFQIQDESTNKNMLNKRQKTRLLIQCEQNKKEKRTAIQLNHVVRTMDVLSWEHMFYTFLCMLVFIAPWTCTMAWTMFTFQHPHSHIIPCGFWAPVAFHHWWQFLRNLNKIHRCNRRYHQQSSPGYTHTSTLKLHCIFYISSFNDFDKQRVTGMHNRNRIGVSFGQFTYIGIYNSWQFNCTFFK
jgi:hypothetical protein